MRISRINQALFYNFKGMEQNHTLKTPEAKIDTVNFSPKSKYLAQANKFKGLSAEISKKGSQINDKSQSLFENARIKQSEASDILDKAKEISSSIQELLNYAEKNNFKNKINPITKKIEAEFFINSDGNLIIKDYRDPNCKRTTTVSEDRIKILIRTSSYQFYCFDRRNGELIEFFDGLDDSNKKELRAKKHFTFENEKLSSADINYTRDNREIERSENHSEYKNGQPSSIKLYWHSNKKSNNQYSIEDYNYTDGTLESLSCKKSTTEENQRISSYYNFKADGSLNIYAKNLEIKTKKTQADYLFQFDENRFTVWRNRKHFSDDITLSDALYSFKDNCPESCIINYRQAKSYPIMYDSKIDF